MNEIDREKIKLFVFQMKLGRFLPESILKSLEHRFIFKPRMKNLGIEPPNTPLFDTVYFEVRTKCNGTCSFCAASASRDVRKDSMMPMDMYKKVIDELQGMQYAGHIAYHVNNDPLIFPKLAEFVEYARKGLPKSWIRILTNGKALTLRKAEELLSAGINELTINYYNEDRLGEFPKVFRQISRGLLPKFFQGSKISKGIVRDREDRSVFKYQVSRRNPGVVLTSRAGTAPNKKAKSQLPRGFCELPFRQFNITTDGRVSKCCADFYFSDPMGNVNQESLMDIWKGSPFENTRELLIKGRREQIDTCRNCDYYGTQILYSNIGKLVYLISQ